MGWLQCVMLLPLDFPLFFFLLDVGEEGGCRCFGVARLERMGGGCLNLFCWKEEKKTLTLHYTTLHYASLYTFPDIKDSSLRNFKNVGRFYLTTLLSFL